MRRVVEALAVGAGGGVAGWATGSLVGLPALGFLLGSLNGVVSGFAGIYDWRSRRGWTAAILDSTWGLVGTALGLALHAVNVVWPGSGYVESLSRRRCRHVYAAGASLRGGFALSMGNVISNAGGKVGLKGESERARRRRRFVTAHEELHIWQNRWFGPLFHITYGGWLVMGGIVGLMLWPVVRGRLFNAIETVAYYDNPFEYWAYRNDGYWPPRGIHPKLGWKRRIG